MARDADPDLGFPGRMLALCSLPRVNPGKSSHFIRRNGPLSLTMTAGNPAKLPYGNLPRLLLAWVCTEAVRTQRRDLILGKSLSDFMRRLDIDNQGGYGRRRLRDQMERLFPCTISLYYKRDDKAVRLAGVIADKTVCWWDYDQPDTDSLFPSEIRLSEPFFRSILRARPCRPQLPSRAPSFHLGPRSLSLAHLPNLHPQKGSSLDLDAGLRSARLSSRQARR